MRDPRTFQGFRKPLLPWESSLWEKLLPCCASFRCLPKRTATSVIPELSLVEFGHNGNEDRVCTTTRGADTP